MQQQNEALVFFLKADNRTCNKRFIKMKTILVFHIHTYTVYNMASETIFKMHQILLYGGNYYCEISKTQQISVIRPFLFLPEYHFQ